VIAKIEYLFAKVYIAHVFTHAEERSLEGLKAKRRKVYEEPGE